MPRQKRKSAAKKKKRRRRLPPSLRHTMAKHTSLHGLNVIELMTELMRRKVPKPGQRRYEFKPMAPQRAQRRTFRTFLRGSGPA